MIFLKVRPADATNSTKPCVECQILYRHLRKLEWTVHQLQEDLERKEKIIELMKNEKKRKTSPKVKTVVQTVHAVL